MTVPFLDLRALHDEVRGELDACWDHVVSHSSFVGGPAVDAFEERFSAYCEQSHAVGVANGTDALALILRSLGVGAGDEVIVPANTFVATAEAVVDVGAQPVFVDVDADTLLMGAAAVEAALTGRTAAVMVVHLYGQMPDMDALSAVCDRAGVALIEDAAQAHGARWRGRRAGSFGVASAFSFYPGKNLGALGDGGAVVTGDAALAADIRSRANHGRSPTSATEHHLVGSNSRLDGLQAAVLGVKLARLDEWNERRRQVHDWYGRFLPDAVHQVTVADDAEAVHHLEVVQLDQRDEVRARLASAGVSSGIHYPVPCHHQPAYRSDSTAGALPSLPVAETAAGRILSLPMYPQLDLDAVRAVCSALEEATLETEPRRR